MRVLQDPLFGPEYRALSDGGPVDDRLLIIFFLTVERLRKNSSWKPYLDMLPTTFTNSLWFSDEELLELKGTALYRATELQKKNLLSLFNERVKNLSEKLLTIDGHLESEVTFSDFLWANSVFWSRAQNIPLPHSYVLPEVVEKQDGTNSCDSRENKQSSSHVLSEAEIQVYGQQGETVWVEDDNALATWEVDGTGSVTGVPCSMHLLSGAAIPVRICDEEQSR